MPQNRIRELRQKKNLSQLQLSIELEVTQETISAYEHSKHLPSVTALMKMSQLSVSAWITLWGFPMRWVCSIPNPGSSLLFSSLPCKFPSAVLKYFYVFACISCSEYGQILKERHGE